MALRQKSAKLRVGGVSLPQTFTNALPSVPTVGQTVFFMCSHYGDSAITGVTIAGATAVLDRRRSFGSQVRLDLWRAEVPASPNRNVVLSGSGSGHYITGGAMEVDALASSPLDATGVFDGNATGTTVTVSTSGATVQADELVIAQWTPNFGSTDIGTDVASGYTELWTEDNSDSFQGGAGGFKFVSATGVQSASWTLNVSGGGAYAQIDTYKLASGGGGENTGTGNVTGDATVSGSGAASNVGTGAVTGDATASGSGAATTTGTGAVTGDATASGSGAASNVGTGAVTGDATVSGQSTNFATGDVTGDATVSGSGAASNVGTGDVTGDASASGSGVASNVGSGSVTGDATVIGSEGLLDNTGAGNVTGDATVSGAGVASNVGTGAVTGDATVSGSGSADDTNTGAGNVTTDDATASGSAVASNVGAGSVNVGEATVSGTGAASVTATGEITTADAVASGSGGQFAPTVRAIRVNLPKMTRKVVFPSRLRRIFF